MFIDKIIPVSILYADKSEWMTNSASTLPESCSACSNHIYPAFTSSRYYAGMTIISKESYKPHLRVALLDFCKSLKKMTKTNFITEKSELGAKINDN